MKIFYILLILLPSLVAAQSKDEKQIKELLKRQTISWNEGNVEEFMQGYWKNDSLMFVGRSGITYGWQKTLNNYKKNYPDTAAMGKLDYKILSAKRLSTIYYFVTGKWHLARTLGDLGGFFTLLFRKIKNRW